MNYIMQLNKVFILLCVFVLQVSCASITVELESPPENTTTFTHYSHYWLFGVAGSDSINLTTSCIDGTAVQIKNYFSFEDILLTLGTVGIYSPKSTQIWCVPNSTLNKEQSNENI